MERSTIFHGKIHYKWWFSIVMLVYQRVLLNFPLEPIHWLVISLSLKRFTDSAMICWVFNRERNWFIEWLLISHYSLVGCTNSHVYWWEFQDLIKGYFVTNQHFEMWWYFSSLRQTATDNGVQTFKKVGPMIWPYRLLGVQVYTCHCCVCSRHP